MSDAPGRAGHGSFEGVGAKESPIESLKQVDDPEEQWDREDSELEAFKALLSQAPHSLSVFSFRLEMCGRLKSERWGVRRASTLLRNAKKIDDSRLYECSDLAASGVRS